MKNILKMSGRLLLSFIATSVIAFISMMLVISAEIGFIYKILIGVMFIAFNLIIAFNSAKNSGEDDAKKHAYKPYRGFVSGIVAMLPAIVFTVIYLCVSYNGWNGTNRILADGMYLILYLVFLAYSPLLSAFVQYNPALNVDFAQPAVTMLNNISTPNAVTAPMFLIPIALFALAAGIGYISGYKERASVSDVIKKLKREKNEKI